MSRDDKHFRKATMQENLMLIRARLSDHLSPAEMRELQEAAVRLQECHEMHTPPSSTRESVHPSHRDWWNSICREPWVENHLELSSRSFAAGAALSAIEPNVLERELAEYRYAEIEHDTLGCHVAKTGIYAPTRTPHEIPPFEYRKDPETGATLRYHRDGARIEALNQAINAVRDGLFCGNSHDDILATLHELRDDPENSKWAKIRRADDTDQKR